MLRGSRTVENNRLVQNGGWQQVYAVLAGEFARKHRD